MQRLKFCHKICYARYTLFTKEEISTCVLLKREGMDPILLPMHRKILLAHSFLSRSLNTKHFSFRINHLMIFIINFYTMKLMTLKGLWYLVGIKVCVTARHFRYQIPSSHLYVFSLHKGSFKGPKLQFCHNSNEKCRCRHIICVLLKRKENLSFFCLCIEQ